MTQKGEVPVGVTATVESATQLMSAPGEVVEVRRYCQAKFHDVPENANMCPICGCRKITEERVEKGILIEASAKLATEHPPVTYGNFACPLPKQLGATN